MPASKLDHYRRFLAALENGASGDALAAYFHPEAIHDEYPNLIVPKGAHRDFKALKESVERGKALMRSQRFEVMRAFESGDTVMLELDWSGTLAIAVKHLPAGYTMRAKCAVFATYRDGLIAWQRNYDCYEPF